MNAKRKYIKNVLKPRLDKIGKPSVQFTPAQTWSSIVSLSPGESQCLFMEMKSGMEFTPSGMPNPKVNMGTKHKEK